MTASRVEIRVRGRDIQVPGTQIAGRTVVVTGRALRIAAVMDEELVEGGAVPDPPAFFAKLAASGLRADLFTFPDRIDQCEREYQYTFEWDNAAVASTASVDAWWSRVTRTARQTVKKAAQRGVSVQVTTLDDELVKGIKSIYDETPIRQEKRFWHYGKSLERVRFENSTYLDRTEFIGAYYNGELIGFVRFVYVDHIATILQFLSKTAHFDKGPASALIAKAVEVCHDKGIAYLHYSKFRYGNNTQSQLTDFKRRNGFVEMRFRRYYVPLTVKGRIALRLKLHRGLRAALPSGVIAALLRARSLWLRLIQQVGAGRGVA